MTDRNLQQGLGLTNLVLGLWLFVSPFVLSITSAGQWHLYFWGAALAIVGGYQTWRASRGFGPVTGVAVVVALVGLWIAVSPLVYTYGMAAIWSNIIVGVLLAISGVMLTVEANRRTARYTA